MWADFVNFAILYGIKSQGYCHLVVATMAILSFGAMCRYNDVSRLQWGNIKFEKDLSSFEITFEIRKNSQLVICPLKLLLKLKDMDPKSGCDSSPIFCGFNGRLVAKNPQKTIPFDVPIKYTQYVRYLSLWFGEVLEISTQKFKAQH